MFKLLEELDFIIVIHEVWVQLSVVTKIIKYIKECLSISVQEHFARFIFLQFYDTFEPLVEQRPWHRAQSLSVGLQVMCSTDI